MQMDYRNLPDMVRERLVIYKVKDNLSGLIALMAIDWEVREAVRRLIVQCAPGESRRDLLVQAVHAMKRTVEECYIHGDNCIQLHFPLTDPGPAPCDCFLSEVRAAIAAADAQ